MEQQKKKAINPFYALLVPAGAVFCITAVAYGMMAFRAVNSGRVGIGSDANHPLYAWLSSHGTTALLIELAVLAVLTVGAIGTDSYWSRPEAEPGDDATPAED